MVKWLLCGFFLSCFAFAEVNGQDILPELINTHQIERPTEIENRVNHFVKDLQKKRVDRSDQDFLNLIFNEAHRKFFKTYRPYSQFSDLFKKGRYDCLTATSLLAVMLDSFGYEFEVIETNYHIFILAETSSGLTLMESTDPVYGFVTDEKEISERIDQYKLAENMAADKAEVELIYEPVDPTKLSGLLLYNQAVAAYNKKDFVKSTLKVLHSTLIYKSPRTPDFAYKLISAIMQSSYEENLKRNLIRPLIALVSKDVLASR